MLAEGFFSEDAMTEPLQHKAISLADFKDILRRAYWTSFRKKLDPRTMIKNPCDVRRGSRQPAATDSIVRATNLHPRRQFSRGPQITVWRWFPRKYLRNFAEAMRKGAARRSGENAAQARAENEDRRLLREDRSRLLQAQAAIGETNGCR